MDNQKCWTVYKHISPSNKVYIGITSKTTKDRWMSGYGYRQNDHFNKAIKKYGWKNIKHEILFTNLTQEEAEQKEKELISLYKSNDRRYGYNNANGGIYGGNIKTKREKEHQREDKLEKWSNPEYREMVLEKLIAKHGLKVECIETGKKYISITEAEKDTKIYHRIIKSCCDGKRESCKGLHWRYWGDNWFRNTTNYKYRVNSKKVSMYNLDGSLIKTFQSINEASRETNIGVGLIYRRLKGLAGRKGEFGQYIWKYASEVQ